MMKTGMQKLQERVKNKGKDLNKQILAFALFTLYKPGEVLEDRPPVQAHERRSATEIVGRTGSGEEEFEQVIRLKSSLPKSSFSSVQNCFPSGSYIVRQGTTGDTFYIICEGKVRVTRKGEGGGGAAGGEKEEEIRVLGRGDYFGEQALLRSELRTANVVALPKDAKNNNGGGAGSNNKSSHDGAVECLVLDRE